MLPTRVDLLRRRLLAACAIGPSLALAAPVAVPGMPGAPARAASAPAADGAVRLPDGTLLPADIGRVVQRGELLVAVPAIDLPPFVQAREAAAGGIDGLDARLARRLAQALGVGLRVDRSAADADGVVERVALGEADVGLGGLAPSPAFAQRVRLSEPHARLRLALLAHRAGFARAARGQPLAPAVRGFSATLGVVEGTPQAAAAARLFPRAVRVGFPSWEAVVEALRQGQVVAGLREEAQVRASLEADPALALSLRAIALSDARQDAAVAVGPRDAMLHALVNLVIARDTEAPR